MGEGDVGGVVHELAEFEDAGGSFEVEVEAHVDAALAEVAVHGARVAVLVHEGADGAEIAAELGGIDGGVFPALPSGADAGDEGGGSEAGFADVPDTLGFVGGVDAGGGLRREGFHCGDEGAGLGVGVGLVGGTELNDEEAVAGWEELEVGERFLFAAERVEEIAVDTFEADGFVLEDLGDVVGGKEDVGEADADEGAAGWGFDELQCGAEDDGASAFAAD